MELSLSAEALEDMEEIIVWLRNNKPQSAMATYDKIDAAMQRLKEFPELGRIGRIEGTREQVVAGTGYVIYYELRRPGFVDVLRVRHGMQGLPVIR
ncbi:MAG: type II toxin-antitoxin system RelE/ParE family toxin [Myxococcota bacterium]